GINEEAWEAAIASLEKHWDNAYLKRPLIMTLIDFTLPAKSKRLWTFNLVLQYPLAYTFVSHGVNSGGKGVAATKFSNKSKTHKPCIAGFATYHKTHSSELGGVSGLGLRVHGLDPGVNNNAKIRGIVFHGAKYVKETGAGRSWGCFAT